MLLQRAFRSIVTLAFLWNGIAGMPARAEDDISVVSSSDGRVEVFFSAADPEGGVFHAWQWARNADTPSNLGAWSAWERFAPTPDAGSQIVSARGPSGKLFVAWISKGAIWFAQQGAANAGFNAPVSTGTQGLHGLTLAMNADGRIEMFALSSAGAAWAVYETSPDSLSWASKLIGGTQLQSLAPAPYFDGRLGLAALGADGRVYFTAQYAPGGDWYPWTGLQGHDIKAIAAAANADGRLNVAAIGGDGAFYEASQNQVGEQTVGGWSEWRYRAAGPFIGPIKLRRNGDGRLEAIMRKSDRGVVHTWQKTPNGSWADEVADYSISMMHGFDAATLTDDRIALISFRNWLPTANGRHAETAFAAVSQVQPNTSWAISVPPPSALYTKAPPPLGITISSFAPTPVYVDQGQYADLNWTLVPTGGCTPANLALFEKVYQQAESKIFEDSAPPTSGHKSVTPPVISSPVYYRLTVGCKQGGAAANRETELAFGMKQPMVPLMVGYGPFVTPSPPHEKKPFTISWTFQNVGTADSAAADVELYLDDMKEGDTKTVSKLGPAQSMTISWSITKEVIGYHHKAEILSGGTSLGLGQFIMEP